VTEALSCGLPVVASRVGGIPDVVEHEKTGLLVEAGDVDGLAEALVSLLGDPDRCEIMGQAAHLFANKHLNARDSVTRLVDLYHELVHGRGGKRRDAVAAAV
jgi:starch synthase